jgi:hypothetical protein
VAIKIEAPSALALAASTCLRCSRDLPAYRSPVVPPSYQYELRRGTMIVATGHVTNDEPLEVGRLIKIGGREGVIRTINPILGKSELRIVVQLPDRT